VSFFIFFYHEPAPSGLFSLSNLKAARRVLYVLGMITPYGWGHALLTLFIHISQGGTIHYLNHLVKRFLTTIAG